MTLDEWIIFEDTGISSKTMWAALQIEMTEEMKDKGYFDFPHDPSDFSRCYNLVKKCNLTKDHLVKIKKIFPWYTPIIDNWDELCELCEPNNRESNKKLYDRLSELGDKMRIMRG